MLYTSRPLALRAPAGDGQENNPDDVEALDLALRRIGAYEPPPEYRDGPQRYPTEPLIDAVKRLQSENALRVEPLRGPDPANPPIKPREASPAPFPAQPHHVPNREELAPPRLDPRDFILITPDQSEQWAEYIFSENRGNEKTRGPLSVIAASARNLVEARPWVKIAHIGGSRDDNGNEIKEHYEFNRDVTPDNPKGRKGSSLADLTLKIDNKFLLHISFYRARADGSPIPIEIDQAKAARAELQKPGHRRYDRKQVWRARYQPSGIRGVSRHDCRRSACRARGRSRKHSRSRCP